MNTFILNFICKDESEVILKMLMSTLPIVDIIVAVDTGSSDNTKELISQFGLDHDIPTFVYMSEFIDYSAARNNAMQKCICVADQLGVDRENCYAFYLDCDEYLVVESGFDKEAINGYQYGIYGVFDGNTYKRDFLWKLFAHFYWKGPIHEIITNDNKLLLSDDIVVGIKFISHPVGHSWCGDLERKYLQHADLLKKYLNLHPERRWAYYLAESYYTASLYTVQAERRKAWMCQSYKYFEQAISIIETAEARNVSDIEMHGVSYMMMAKIDRDL
jgi:glycosyltransferase involved in cell wall biosynthesis